MLLCNFSIMYWAGCQNVHPEKFSTVPFEYVVASEISDNGTRLHLTNKLYKRFLTDHIFRVGHDIVALAEQSKGKMNRCEMGPSQAPTSTPQLLQHVSWNYYIINFYKEGLRTAFKEIILPQVRKMLLKEQRRLSSIDKVMDAASRSLHALFKWEGTSRGASDWKNDMENLSKGSDVLWPVPVLTEEQPMWKLNYPSSVVGDPSIVVFDMGPGWMHFLCGADITVPYSGKLFK